MEKKKIAKTNLSYSSWSQMDSCEMSYAHRKIYSTPVDNEEDDMTAFHVGSACHHCVEETEWGKVPLKQSVVNEAILEYPDAAEHKGLVHAMALKLIEQQTLSGLTCVKAEQQIETPEFNGFIDLIAKDALGNWYIIDLKTSSMKPTGDKLALLPMDRQLNLYASFAEQISGYFDLDMNKYRGCIYRVVVKSKAKQKAGETYNAFVQRVFKLTQVFDVIIPKEMLHVEQIVKDFKEAHERSLELRQGVIPRKNLGACFNYFKLCPYFSQCHGDKSDKVISKVEVKTNKDYIAEEQLLGEL